MIRLLFLALPLSLLGWWALRRVGKPRDKAWMGGVAISFVALGGVVFFSGDDHETGRALAAALWAGVHALLFILLWPFLGRAR